MDIGKAFVDSWNIYRKNVIVLILAFLVFGLVSCLTLGILSYPMMAGFMLMFVRAKRGQEIKLNDIFVPVKANFWRLIGLVVWMSIVMSAIIIPGFIAIAIGWFMIGGLLIFVATIMNMRFVIVWMYSTLLVVDKGQDIKEALTTSRDLVKNNNIWLHLLLLILSGIVSSLGGALYGIGALLTVPLGMGAIACAYSDVAQ